MEDNGIRSALVQLRSEGFEVRDEDVARLSPLGHEHLNALGLYDFSIPETAVCGEHRPLRNPEIRGDDTPIKSLHRFSVPLLLRPHKMKHEKIYRYCTVLLLLLLTGGTAFAGPPLITDDPDTPGDKHWEINVAFTIDKRQNEAIFETPILDLNYGVGDNIQLKYEVPWLIRHEQGDGTQSGLGNSNVGVKWRFIDEEKYGVNMSIYPQFEFNPPTTSADRGLVDKGTNLLLPVEVSKKFGPVKLNGEFGYSFSHHSDNEWQYGVFSGYELLENLTILAEIHGEATTEFKGNEVVFNIGTQWDFSKKYGLLASAGRSFSHATSDNTNLLLYLGLQMRL